MRDEGKGRDTTEDDERLALDASLSPGGKKTSLGRHNLLVGVTFREEAFSARGGEEEARRGESAKSVTLSKESGTVAVDDEETRAESNELLSTRDSSTFSTCTETCEANVILLDHEQLTAAKRLEFSKDDINNGVYHPVGELDDEPSLANSVNILLGVGTLSYRTR